MHAASQSHVKDVSPLLISFNVASSSINFPFPLPPATQMKRVALAEMEKIHVLSRNVGVAMNQLKLSSSVSNARSTTA
jgi:hypothetical protein